MSAMPSNMPGSIGIPANTKPVLRAIQNIGKCRITPTPTIAEPNQKASALRPSADNIRRSDTNPWERDVISGLRPNDRLLTSGYPSPLVRYDPDESFVMFPHCSQRLSGSGAVPQCKCNAECWGSRARSEIAYNADYS